MLCHDDELEGRRIAYIFYLVPHDWDKSDGGIVHIFFQNNKIDDSSDKCLN